MRLALPVLVAILAASTITAHAAELPAAFHGVWRIANSSGSACRAADARGAAEGHIVVKPGLIQQYESSCRIAAARATRRSEHEPFSIAATLSCSGEGMRWRDRTLWHLETVDGKRLIAVTTLGSTAYDLGGRRMPPRTLPITAIYTECR